MYIQKTKEGSFRFYAGYKDPLTGSYKRATVTLPRNTTQSRIKAQRLLEARIEELTKKEPARPAVMTLAELVDAYAAAQAGILRPQTITRNTIIMSKAAEMFPGVPVDNLNARLVSERFSAWEAAGVTKNGRIRRFKTLMRWAYRMDYVKDISWLDKLPIYPDSVKARRDLKYLEPAELRAVLEAAAGEYRDVIEFMALSGLRIGEVIALEPSDVDTVIHVNKTYSAITGEIGPAKTADSVRDVYIQKELRAVLDRIDKSGPALFKRSGRQIDYYAFNKYFRELTARTIGRPLSTHALRHTHTSLLAAAGIPLDVISRRLGHADSKVSREIYLHVTELLKDKDAALLDAVTLI